MGILASSSVPLEEYLHSSYEPDCEYVDGELVERNSGEFPHADLQGLLYAYFLRRRRKWEIAPIIEQRIRMSENKYRIPDVCIYRGPKPTERVPTQPPWIWIEVLSPDDRPIRVQRKVTEVLAFGSEYVWVIDPETLESVVYTPKEQKELTDGVFRIEGTGVVVPLRDLDED